jgi:DNA processing protein
VRLARSDGRFPPRLSAIFDPPPALYLRGSGEPELLARRAVAVVGARSCSPYGAQVARMLGRELSAAGVVVVSGLARGIDGEAHRGALEGGGPTVGVLGCGIDRDYPAVNAPLSRRMEDGGLVVSEYEPGIEPAPWRFPARKRRGGIDRQISLSQAVVSAVQVAGRRARVAWVRPGLSGHYADWRVGRSLGAGAESSAARRFRGSARPGASRD